MTQLTPSAWMAMGACSRELQQPKLCPATTMSPGRIWEARAGSTPSKQWGASFSGSKVRRCLAGMITSVSTWSPSVQALPSRTPATALISSQLVRGADPPQDGGGGGDVGVDEVDLGPGGALPPDEVAVRGGDGAHAVPEDPHVRPDARPAGGGAEYAARVEHRLGDPLPEALAVDPGRARDDDEPDPFGHLPALEDAGGRAHVRDPAVGAGADVDLVHPDFPGLGEGPRVAGEVGEGHHRL